MLSKSELEPWTKADALKNVGKTGDGSIFVEGFTA
jgi:hypothetical protein